MNKRESKKMMGNCYAFSKMKRIALIFLSMVSIVSCIDNEVEPPGPPTPENGKGITLNVLIPKNSTSTYANEDADKFENYIDSVYIVLKQSGNPIDTSGFKRGDVSVKEFSNDSVLYVKYEVDNITSTTGLTVDVYANKMTPRKITEEIPMPGQTMDKSFFMSGTASLAPNGAGTGFEGEVHVTRNVAKLRVNVSRNIVSVPDDLEIDYDNIKIQVVKTPNTTSKFASETALNLPNTDYISYTERGPLPLQPLHRSSSFVSTGPEKDRGGQIDSLYLYENRRTSSYDINNKTQVKVTIPTKSATEGSKTADYTYELYTRLDGGPLSFDILRNHIYILDIKVRGQSLEPLITLDIEKWNDVNISGSIGGTYLTTDVSEILFDGSGKATINFCTDAQAIYFDFKTFNDNNPGTTLGVGNSFNLRATGNIDTTDLSLSPSGFQSGQILLDKGHCGSFGFELDLTKFPQFPNINFSGSICIRAGNIEKCFTFPGINLYDAHFIVGDTILKGEKFISATTEGGSWLEVSPNRLYTTTAGTSYSGSDTTLYLHLNENLTGIQRSGSITLTNSSGATKRVYISQLPAIPVGRFGYSNNPTSDDRTYTAGLFTEQLYEYNVLVPYANTKTAPFAAVPSTNFIFNGWKTTEANATLTNYTNSGFNYQNELYTAISYCAYKNRPASKSSTTVNILWYLPSQAQLMGMWASYESHKDISTSTFKDADSLSYWSATANGRSVSGVENEAQYLNFKYGNVGHVRMSMGGNNGRSEKWATRCVRNGNSTNYPTSSMIEANNTINFEKGMPDGSYMTTGTKIGGATENENGVKNKTLFKKLRVATTDHSLSPAKWSETPCTGAIDGITGGWRLPTQRELQAIWILQGELKTANPSFKLLGEDGDDYYWSVTGASRTQNAPNSYTNIWVVYSSVNEPGGSGNTPHRHKDELSRVRCVREQP